MSSSYRTLLPILHSPSTPHSHLICTMWSHPHTHSPISPLRPDLLAAHTIPSHPSTTHHSSQLTIHHLIHRLTLFEWASSSAPLILLTSLTYTRTEDCWPALLVEPSPRRRRSVSWSSSRTGLAIMRWSDQSGRHVSDDRSRWMMRVARCFFWLTHLWQCSHV